MKFLIDEQLPPLLADWLAERGHDALHVPALLTGSRIADGFICQRSMSEGRVVIKKDVDFLNTFLVKHQPFKLVYLTTGNLKNRESLNLFRANFAVLEALLGQHQVIEFSRAALRVWF